MKADKTKKLGRPPGPLTAVAFEKEIAALQRLAANGTLTVQQFNDKYVALLTRFRDGK